MVIHGYIILVAAVISVILDRIMNWPFYPGMTVLKLWDEICAQKFCCKNGKCCKVLMTDLMKLLRTAVFCNVTRCVIDW
jgi:hypothetical protein